jgi:hypothetical protein
MNRALHLWMCYGERFSACGTMTPRQARKVCVSAICLWIFVAVSSASSAEPEKAMPVTILKANIAGRTVLVRTMDGKEESIPFESGVSVTSIAEAAMNQRLSGGAGYQFLIVYNNRYGKKTITAFHYAGKDAWNAIRGNIETINSANRRLVLKTAEGTDLTFQAGENCAMNTNTGVKMFSTWAPLEAWAGSEVVAYYMEGKTGRILQLIEPPSP